MAEGNSLDITIRTIAELAGAEQAARSLEMQIGKAKALGQDYSENQAKLDKINASLRNAKLPVDELATATKGSTEKQEELNEAIKHGGEEAEHSHLSHRALHKILGGIGNEVAPGMGHALGAALYGPIGAGVALVAIFEQLKGKIEAFNEELEKQAEWAAEPLVEKWGAIQAAINTAAEDIAKFRAAYEAAGTDHDPLKTALEQEKQLMDAQVESQKRLIEAKYALTEATLRANEAELESQGKGNKDAMDVELLNLAQEKSAALAGLEAGKKTADFQRAAYERNQREMQASALARNAEITKGPAMAARAEAEDVNKRLEKNKAIVDPASDLHKQLQSAKDAVAQKQQDIATDQSRARVDGTGFWSAMAGKNQLQLPALQQTVADLESKMSVAARQYADDKKHAEEVNQRATELGIAYADAKKAAEENKTKLEELNRQLPVLKEIYDRQIATARQVEQMGAQTTGQKTAETLAKTPAGQAIGEGFALADIVERGGKLDGSQTKLLGLIARQLGFHVDTTKQAADALEGVKLSTDGFVAASVAFVNYAKSTNITVANQQKQIETLTIAVQKLKSDSFLP